MNLSNFFKRFFDRQPKKHVVVYISERHGQIIICPRYKAYGGILYEQDTCTVLPLPTDHTTLGEEVLRNFHLFALKDGNFRDHKRSDWPAYKTSGLKTIKSFESSYVPIEVSGNNKSNIILIAEASFAQDLFVKSSVSASAGNKAVIGECIMKVYAFTLSQLK